MIPARTTIRASVSGSFDQVKTPEWLERHVRDNLAAWGAVIDVDVQSGVFSSSYVATVAYVTRYEHSSIEDIRATIAGIFETFNGLRPAVSIMVPAGEPPVQVPGSPINPFPQIDIDPAKWTPLVVGIGVILALIVLAPTVRGLSGR